MIFALLLLLGVVAGAQAELQVKISRFQGQRITGVDVGGAFKVTIRQGAETGATLDIPARFEKELVFSLNSEGKLKIGFTGNINGKNGDIFAADIVCSSLEDLDITGACELTGEGDFNGRKLSVDLSGASKVRLNGSIDIEGKLDIDLSGASRFSADIRASVVDIDLSGASNFSLSGAADTGKMETSGATNANLENCVFRILSASASGASNIKVNASERLNISGSGASKISYRGNAKLSVNTSGATTIRQL